MKVFQYAIAGDPVEVRVPETRDDLSEFQDWFVHTNAAGPTALVCPLRNSRRAFYGAMEERGIQRTRVTKGMALVGVALAGAGIKPTGPGIFGNDD